MFNQIKCFTGRIRRQFGSMSSQRTRHFVNPKPDYETSFGFPEIPSAEIISSLDSIILKIENGVKPTEKNASDGIYLGTAGITYMFYHLSKIQTLLGNKEYLNKAIEYLKPALNVASCVSSKNTDMPSFILGNCGIYAVASAVYKAVGDETRSEHFMSCYYKAANICKEQNFLSCGSDELFVGRAGFILGALWLSNETGTPIPKQDIYEMCKVILKSGRTYAKRHQSPCPLMYAYYQVEYLGAAHGLCSILQALISVPGYLDANPTDAVDIKSCIDFLLTVQSSEGNFPAATDEIGRTSDLVHWCHGAGGIAYLMAKAYLVFGEDKYLVSCKRMSDLIWEKGLLKKGPGLCHGVAGNGYVFLLLYRLTNDPKYLYRAIQFYKFLGTGEFQSGARTPDYPYSLYEGLAGTACYLADLTSPMQASFPFSDVFATFSVK
nr:lanC-like protein 3 homolog [Leptinotarsa decemlineata]